MKSFLCKVLIPSTGKYEYFREIDFLTSKTISKYIKNNDIVGFSKCVENIVKSNGVEQKSYHVLDILAVLCQLRSYCYGDTVKLEGRSENGSPVVYKHSINRVLNTSSLIKECDDQYVYKKDLELCIGLPHNLLPDDDFDVISRNIRELKAGSDRIIFSDLKNFEKERILQNLDASFSGEIIKFTQKIVKLFENTNLFEEMDIKDFKNIKLNPYNESIVQYLVSIFNYDLMSIYELEYILIRRLRFSLSDLKNMTIIEAELHLNLYKKEVETIENIQKKNGVEK
jgi:hypothetical protein